MAHDNQFFFHHHRACLPCAVHLKGKARRPVALLYVNQNLFDNAANALSEKLCDYTEDYNGNGEVLYRVNNVSYNGNNLAGVNYSVANSKSCCRRSPRRNMCFLLWTSTDMTI